MLKKVPKHVIDIRDIACDGYGLTAATSAINRYVSKYLNKLTADLERKTEHPKEEQKRAT